MTDFYFSFGFGQPHFPGYARITADNMATARAIMHINHQRKWCTGHDRFEDLHPDDRRLIASYHQNDFEKQLESYRPQQKTS